MVYSRGAWVPALSELVCLVFFRGGCGGEKLCPQSLPRCERPSWGCALGAPGADAVPLGSLLHAPPRSPLLLALWLCPCPPALAEPPPRSEAAPGRLSLEDWLWSQLDGPLICPNLSELLGSCRNLLGSAFSDQRAPAWAGVCTWAGGMHVCNVCMHVHMGYMCMCGGCTHMCGMCAHVLCSGSACT